MATKFRIGNIGLYATYQDAVNDYASGANSFAKKFSTYTCSNSLQYATSPYRDNSFTMRNDEEVISAKYVPTVSFTFYAMNEEVYQWFIQLTNTRGFFVRYYDFELGVDVIRYMYMTDQSTDKIQTSVDDSENQFGYIKNIIGLKITFVSKLAYDSYDDLITLATGDTRMLPRVDTPEYTFDIETRLLTLTCDTEDATIKYTTEQVTASTIGDVSWAEYTTPITIPSGQFTYTAYATKFGMNRSFLLKIVLN